MRAPAFWGERRPSLAAQILRPAALVYAVVAARRLEGEGERAGVPVVCVGNFTVGGTGKTPAAIAVARLLQDIGARPAFLTRGYGGRLVGPARVDAAAHGPEDVGDEPLLLAGVAPTIVARHRDAGARACVDAGAGIIVMDDGLQNPSLHKDFSLAVVDAAIGLGNGLCLPAGPLRAPLSAQWPLVSAVLLVGEGAGGEDVAKKAAVQRKLILRGSLKPEPAAAARLDGQRVLGFAGIGRPEKFFETLERCGAIVAHKRAFADHHMYSAEDIRALLDEAKRNGLLPVTTEKDRVRIAALGPELAAAVAVLPVALVFADEAAVRARLGALFALPG